MRIRVEPPRIGDAPVKRGDLAPVHERAEVFGARRDSDAAAAKRRRDSDAFKGRKQSIGPDGRVRQTELGDLIQDVTSKKRASAEARDIAARKIQAVAKKAADRRILAEKQAKRVQDVKAADAAAKKLPVDVKRDTSFIERKGVSKEEAALGQQKKSDETKKLEADQQAAAAKKISDDMQLEYNASKEAAIADVNAKLGLVEVLVQGRGELLSAGVDPPAINDVMAIFDKPNSGPLDAATAKHNRLSGQQLDTRAVDDARANAASARPPSSTDALLPGEIRAPTTPHKISSIPTTRRGVDVTSPPPPRPPPDPPNLMGEAGSPATVAEVKHLNDAYNNEPRTGHGDKRPSHEKPKVTRPEFDNRVGRAAGGDGARLNGKRPKERRPNIKLHTADPIPTNGTRPPAGARTAAPTPNPDLNVPKVGGESIAASPDTIAKFKKNNSPPVNTSEPPLKTTRKNPPREAKALSKKPSNGSERFDSFKPPPETPPRPQEHASRPVSHDTGSAIAAIRDAKLNEPRVPVPIPEVKAPSFIEHISPDLDGGSIITNRDPNAPKVKDAPTSKKKRPDEGSRIADNDTANAKKRGEAEGVKNAHEGDTQAMTPRKEDGLSENPIPEKAHDPKKVDTEDAKKRARDEQKAKDEADAKKKKAEEDLKKKSREEERAKDGNARLKDDELAALKRKKEADEQRLREDDAEITLRGRKRYNDRGSVDKGGGNTNRDNTIDNGNIKREVDRGTIDRTRRNDNNKFKRPAQAIGNTINNLIPMLLATLGVATVAQMLIKMNNREQVQSTLNTINSTGKGFTKSLNDKIASSYSSIQDGAMDGVTRGMADGVADANADAVIAVGRHLINIGAGGPDEREGMADGLKAGMADAATDANTEAAAISDDVKMRILGYYAGIIRGMQHGRYDAASEIKHLFPAASAPPFILDSN
jgi:hypothetical protein